MKISVSTARRLALGAQGLDGGWGLPRGKEGAARVLERLGYVQIDTIAVIERAHHHTLWSRCPRYAPRMLDDLLARDRRVFEGWTHAASYLPISDYRYYLPKMRSAAERPRTRRWLDANRDLVRAVVDRIRDEGPLGSADFVDRSRKRGSWWDWKPAKVALETLLDTGTLMVAERRNFQRIYDLTERVLPADVDRREPDPEASARFAARRALGSLGVASTADLGWRTWGCRAGDRGLEELLASGEAKEAEVEGLEGERCFVSTRALEEAETTRRKGPRLHLLSPFDNLIIGRARIRRLFGFDYSLECYLPEARRKHGYFCLPILYGDRFVGRLDPKADRAERTFRIRRLALEPGLREPGAVLAALAKRLRSFAGFQGCDRIVLERAEPARVGSAFRRELGG